MLAAAAVTLGACGAPALGVVRGTAAAYRSPDGLALECVPDTMATERVVDGRDPVRGEVPGRPAWSQTFSGLDAEDVARWRSEGELYAVWCPERACHPVVAVLCRTDVHCDVVEDSLVACLTVEPPLY